MLSFGDLKLSSTECMEPYWLTVRGFIAILEQSVFRSANCWRKRVVLSLELDSKRTNEVLLNKHDTDSN